MQRTLGKQEVSKTYGQMLSELRTVDLDIVKSIEQYMSGRVSCTSLVELFMGGEYIELDQSGRVECQGLFDYLIVNMESAKAFFELHNEL